MRFLMEEKITDYIYSDTRNKDFALITVQKNTRNEYEYIGEILMNRFPEELLILIADYHKAIDEFMFSLVESIEDKIYSYDLKLKKSNTCIHGIFIDNCKIDFFIQYPSAKGYLSERPHKK
jgi:hypothetical protein